MTSLNPFSLQDTSKPVTGMHLVWEQGTVPQPGTGRTTLFSSTNEKVCNWWENVISLYQKGHQGEGQTKFSKTPADFEQSNTYALVNTSSSARRIKYDSTNPDIHLVPQTLDFSQRYEGQKPT
jgi:hypothetical protein